MKTGLINAIVIAIIISLLGLIVIQVPVDSGKL